MYIFQDLPKLMNNSFFGKTCEDVYKYKDVRFICGEDNVIKLQKLQNSPYFDHLKLYGEFSAVLLMRKKKVLLDKPRFVGACILALSKVVMYDFHYNFIIPNFPGIIMKFIHFIHFY